MQWVLKRDTRHVATQTHMCLHSSVYALRYIHKWGRGKEACKTSCQDSLGEIRNDCKSFGYKWREMEYGDQSLSLERNEKTKKRKKEGRLGNGNLT